MRLALLLLLGALLLGRIGEASSQRPSVDTSSSSSSRGPREHEEERQLYLRRLEEASRHVSKNAAWYEEHNPQYARALLAEAEKYLNLQGLSPLASQPMTPNAEQRDPLLPSQQEEQEAQNEAGVTQDKPHPLAFLDHLRLPLAEELTDPPTPWDPAAVIKTMPEMDCTCVHLLLFDQTKTNCGHVATRQQPDEPPNFDYTTFVYPEQPSCRAEEPHRAKHPEVVVHLPQMLQLALDLFRTSFPKGMLLVRNHIPAEVYQLPGKAYIEQIKVLHLQFPTLFDIERYDENLSFITMQEGQIQLRLKDASMRVEVDIASNKGELPGLSLLRRWWAGKKRDISRFKLDIELYDLELDLAISPFIKDRFLHLQLEKVPWTTIVSDNQAGRYVLQNEMGSLAFRLKLHRLQTEATWLRSIVEAVLGVADQPMFLSFSPDVFDMAQTYLHRIGGMISQMVHQKLFAVLYPYLAKLQLELPDLDDEHGQVPPSARRHCYDVDMALLINPRNAFVPYNQHMMGMLIADQMVLRADRLPEDPMAEEFPVPQVPSDFAGICRKDPYASGCGIYRGAAFENELRADEEDPNFVFDVHPQSTVRYSRYNNDDNLYGSFVRWVQTRIHHHKGFDYMEPRYPEEGEVVETSVAETPV